MNRKFFLSLIPASLCLPTNVLVASPNKKLDSYKSLKVPPYLVPGDTIGITCPAGYITEDEIAPAILQMESWGFKVKIGKTVGARDNTFGGTDDQRLSDLQQMLDDPAIKAIMCARGGYGAIRIIDQLDFKIFRSAPKWLIGFSDITILHSHINNLVRVATIHSKMCNSFPSDWTKADSIQIDTINSIANALKGMPMRYNAATHPNNKYGTVEGELVGGNLRCIENVAGSISEIETDGKILFLEDTGEYLYSIDRMFFNLKRSGKLAKLKGLIIGGFKIKQDTPDNDPFGKTLVDIVLEKVKEYDYPVGFEFPVGHQRANYALKCGVKHHLTINENGITLKAVGV